MLVLGLTVLLVMVFIIQAVAFVTLYERHLLGGSQSRIGPNKVSFMGLVQAIFDGIKLLKKEESLPVNSSVISFVVVPGVAFIVMFMEWFVLPYFFDFYTLEYGMLFFLVMVGFSVYAVLVSGLVSKSKYGLIGALRASSQSISYEIAFSLYMLVYVVHVGMFSFVKYYSISLFIIYFPFLFMILAELNRAPFDFAEGESELVSGFNVEYSSVGFVLLFLSEYGCLLFFSVLSSVLFFNFSFLMSFLVFSVLIFVRSSYPRYRYDFMMGVFWFKLLPLSLVFLGFFVVFLVFE